MEDSFKEDSGHLNILMTLFQYAESGRLSEIDTDKYLMAIIRYAIAPDTGDYKLRLKKFRQGILNFTKKLETTLANAEESSDKIAQMISKELKKKASLPKFTNLEDNDRIISFAKKLENEVYNFSVAEALLEGKITRQTLTKKIKDGFLGISPIYKSKSAYIKKEDLIKLYRHFFETDTWGF